MNLPDTFAGGTFNLPLKVAKIVRLGQSSEVERQAANVQLAKHGYFLDRVGILWPLDKVPELAKDNPTNN